MSLSSFSSLPSLYDLRRSTAELLAAATLDVFPGALMVEGKATEFGFYYDFIAEQPIDIHALTLLEEKMRGLIKSGEEIRVLDMMRENAISFFEHREQPIRANKISVCRNNIISIFQQGNFYDFCELPYITESQQIGAFKLLDIEKTWHFLPEEGAIEVTRIHGTAAYDKMALKKLIKAREAGKKKDHRQISKEINFFELKEAVSTEEWEWLPRGNRFRNLLLDWWSGEHRKQNFEVVSSPSLIKESLSIKAGIDEESQGPYCQIDNENYVIPTNLSPSHAILFKSKLLSYKDLPIKIAECGRIYSLTNNGVLWGILNSRIVESDQAHIFCIPEQVEKELISSLQFIAEITKIFSFECHWYLRGQAAKSAGKPSAWKKGIESFCSAFEKCNLSYEYNEQDGVFAGPIAVAHLVDAMGREWNGPSIGIDFSIPERLELRYRTEEGKERPPILLVRSLFGSLERFTAILIEHVSGRFPLWIAPEQVRVVPVTEENDLYAETICKKLVEAGFRANTMYGPDSLGAKIHSAEKEKIPYMVIVGEKEEKQHLITVRSAIQESVKQAVTLEAFLLQLQQEVNTKAMP